MSETKKSQIFDLMPRVMADVRFVAKTGRNQQQNYAFRGIDEIYKAVQPVFAKLGLFVLPTVLSNVREERQTKSGTVLTYTILTVKHTFYAPDGSSVETVTMGEAMDSGDKSCNKAMSAAMKYAIIEAFCIPCEEPIDTENESHEVAPVQLATPQQVREIKELIATCEISDDVVQKWFNKANAESWQDFRTASRSERRDAHPRQSAISDTLVSSAFVSLLPA
jgi:hypothetical protein